MREERECKNDAPRRHSICRDPPNSPTESHRRAPHIAPMDPVIEMGRKKYSDDVPRTR